MGVGVGGVTPRSSGNLNLTQEALVASGVMVVGGEEEGSGTVMARRFPRTSVSASEVLLGGSPLREEVSGLAAPLRRMSVSASPLGQGLGQGASSPSSSSSSSSAAAPLPALPLIAIIAPTPESSLLEPSPVPSLVAAAPVTAAGTGTGSGTDPDVILQISSPSSFPVNNDPRGDLNTRTGSLRNHRRESSSVVGIPLCRLQGGGRGGGGGGGSRFQEEEEKSSSSDVGIPLRRMGSNVNGSGSNFNSGEGQGQG